MISPLLLLLLLPLFSPFEVKEEEKTGEGVYFEVPEIRASPPCPTGWILIDKGNTTTSYCYFQPDLSLTWADARAYCQNIGGELVSLYNRTEYDEVIASVVKPSIYLTYTGLYKNGSIWRWSDGTSTSTAAYWLPGQPDANGGNCSAWKTSDTSGFQTVPCQKSQPFICKQMAARCAPYRSGTSTSTGSFTSPNYPNNYENNLDCFYYVVYTYRNNTVVYINFSPFDLEARYDYVTLYDGPDTTAPILVANVSGNYSYETHFESSYNALTVHFHTDGSITRKGFKANWRILTVPDIIYLNESNFGEVSSVNYPQTYDNYINQEYYFTTDPGFQVNLTFDAFITEQRYDYVLAFDGPLVNGTSPLIANLTGNLTQTILDTGAINLLSSNNTLTLKFITDASVVRTGWHLFYNYV